MEDSCSLKSRRATFNALIVAELFGGLLPAIFYRRIVSTEFSNCTAHYSVKFAYAFLTVRGFWICRFSYHLKLLGRSFGLKSFHSSFI